MIALYDHTCPVCRVLDAVPYTLAVTLRCTCRGHLHPISVAHPHTTEPGCEGVRTPSALVIELGSPTGDMVVSQFEKNA